jgi:hydrogenase/urease accessory protein HupE
MSGHLAALFEVNVPVSELLVRGSVIYWFLFVVFRFVLRRDVSWAVGWWSRR